MTRDEVRASLEEQIRDRPHDWDSWLVYGDLLSEAGDVRGELIALEHRRTMGQMVDDDIRAIVKQHRRKWTVPKMPKSCELELRNGFVVGATFPLAMGTLETLTKLLTHPKARLLRELRLRQATERPDDLDDHDWDEPYVPPPMPVELLKGAMDAPLDAIRSLAIEYGSIGEEAASLLAASPHLEHLTALDLRFTFLNDASVAALVGEAKLDRLATLNLHRNTIGADGAMAIASAKHLGGLRHLDLRDNTIGTDGAGALATSANLANLDTLLLYLDDITHAGALALSKSKQLPFRIRRHWAARWSASNEQTEQRAV